MFGFAATVIGKIVSKESNSFTRVSDCIFTMGESSM